MDFIKAKQYILERLEKELPENLYYHNVQHTIDVCNAAEILAKNEGIDHENLLLLQTAALYHDSGFIKTYSKNEAIGASIAKNILSEFDYSSKQIETVNNLILATAISYEPSTHLEKIICDADLDYLGREDFYSISHRLRSEWNANGKTTTLRKWYELQLDFMQEHKYFTNTALSLREEEKQKHIEDIKTLLGNKQYAIKKEPSNDKFHYIKDAGINKIEVLKKVEIFTYSSEEVIREIASHLKVLDVKANQIIFQKDETGNCMYIIYSGKIKVHDDIYTITELGEGKFFGELSLLDTETRSASITAMTDSKLLRLDQEDFYKLLLKYSEVSRNIMRALIGRLRTQNTSIIEELRTREKQLQQLVDERTKELRIANAGLEKAFKEIEEKNLSLGEAYKSIRDSINYAKRIQEAILPNKSLITEALPQSFILYKPKAVVSGDFYWFAAKDDKIIIAAVDCTGHGVPGAFMSMIGNDQLNHIIIERGITKPDVILENLNKGIKLALKQVNELVEVKDGMDIAICCIHVKQNLIEFSGANRPLFMFRNSELQIFLSDKVAIGGVTKENYKFTSHLINFLPDDTFYIFSDGYADQFGGERDKKFSSARFKELLISFHKHKMSEQCRIFDETFENWKGKSEQIDDVMIIGFKF